MFNGNSDDEENEQLDDDEVSDNTIDHNHDGLSELSSGLVSLNNKIMQPTMIGSNGVPNTQQNNHQ